MPLLGASVSRFSPIGWLLLLACSGCGRATDALPREPISGTVTLNGKPLARGTIQFLPAGENQVTMAAAEIKEGTFAITQAQGPVPGAYRVIISSGAPSEAPAGGMPGMSPKPPPDLIPARYNAATTLNAEVKSGGPNTFDFPLKD